MARGDSGEFTLHASLYEIECGLFCVSYRSAASGSRLHALPIYQLGGCEKEARERLEQSARALGFDIIIWEGIEANVPVCESSLGGAAVGSGDFVIRH